MKKRVPATRYALLLIALACFFTLLASASFAARSINCETDDCAGLVGYYEFNDVQFDDSFSAAAINSSRWTVIGATVGNTTISGSELKIAISPGTGWRNAGIGSSNKYFLHGNFDIQVDFNDLVSTIAEGGVIMQVVTSTNDSIYIRRNVPSQNYDLISRVNSVSADLGQVSSTATSGKLRLVRVGNTMRGYYWTGSAWAQVGVANTSVEWAQDVYVNIQLQTRDPSGTNKVDFDNFIVNQGEIIADDSGNVYVGHDNFSTSSIDTMKWGLIYGNTTGTDGSELIINLTPGSGWQASGMQTAYLLKGNFDVQVDYDLQSGTTIDGGAMLRLSSYGGDDVVAMRRHLLPTYQFFHHINNAPNIFEKNASASGTSGKMRLTKTGQNITAWYWSGSAWVNYASSVDLEYAQNMYLRVELSGGTPPDNKQVRYDNFKINSGTLVYAPATYGSIVNATWSTGQQGAAMAYDGNSAYVDLGGWFTNQNFSISMWLKPNTTQNAWATLVDNNHGGSPLFKNWAVQQHSTYTNNYYAFTFGTDDSTCLTFFNLTPDVWQHTTIVRDSTSINAYVNGVLVSSSTTNCNVPVKYVSPSLTLGRHAGIPVRTWKGSMDDVSFWSRPLTLNEIRTMNELPSLNLPNVTTFITGTTNFSTVADLENVPNATLVMPTTSVRWTGLINASGKDFDQYVNMGPGFVSLDVAALGQTINTTAVVNITGINCENFDLYYATGVHSSLASLKASGVLVATQQNTGGNCIDATKCTALSCANGVLTFTAQHFDGFGGDNGTDQPVPEFGTWALLLALGLVAGGMLAVRKRT